MNTNENVTWNINNQSAPSHQGLVADNPRRGDIWTRDLGVNNDSLYQRSSLNYSIDNEAQAESKE